MKLFKWIYKYLLTFEKTVKYGNKDEPTEIDEYGTKYWYRNNKFHRINGPAIEQRDGTKTWYLNGNLHRLGGSAIERTDGSKAWYVNGDLHRIDGPAIEWNGTKEWWINGRTITLDTLSNMVIYNETI